MRTAQNKTTKPRQFHLTAVAFCCPVIERFHADTRHSPHWGLKEYLIRTQKKQAIHIVYRLFLNCIDNNDTVSNSFIWLHSKNETIKREVKLSFGTETMLIRLSNWNILFCSYLSDFICIVIAMVYGKLAVI